MVKKDDSKLTFIPGSIIGAAVKAGAALGAAIGGPVGWFTRGAAIGGLSGLYLSQITTIAAGLTNETVQNWVKRGLVEKPQGKIYDQDQVARILIINSLRRVMDLSQIKKILDFVNGKLEDKSDYIVQETALLYYYTLAVSRVNETNPGKIDDYNSIVAKVLADFQEIRPGDKEKLSKALTIMCIAHQANELKQEADQLIEQLI